MELGVIADAGESDMRRAAQWHRGEPIKRWWGYKFDKASLRPIESWRCISCGLLENYVY